MKYLCIIIIWLSTTAAVFGANIGGGVYLVAAGVSAGILFYEKDPKPAASEEKEKQLTKE